MKSDLEVTEAEIEELLSESKQLPRGFERLFDLKSRRGHTEAQLEITASSGRIYQIRLRQSRLNPLDFSAILGYYLPMSGKLFRLRRYNGKSHEHSNTIEKERFYDFHIHVATERYQLMGADEDRFAVVTDRYTTLMQAFDCLRSDCAIRMPGEDRQPLLF